MKKKIMILQRRYKNNNNNNNNKRCATSRCCYSPCLLFHLQLLLLLLLFIIMMMTIVTMMPTTLNVNAFKSTTNTKRITSITLTRTTQQRTTTTTFKTINNDLLLYDGIHKRIQRNAKALFLQQRNYDHHHRNKIVLSSSCSTGSSNCHPNWFDSTKIRPSFQLRTTTAKRSTTRRIKRNTMILRMSRKTAITENEQPLLQNNNNNNQQNQRLKGCICLVTGASRGIGKGIALELGQQGATVYVTGTSTSGSTLQNGTATVTATTTVGITNDSKTMVVYPGTIEETAYEINQLGGMGIPIVCDHSNDTQVYHGVFQRIALEQNNTLDILVNNCFRTPSNRMEFLIKKFWEQGPEGWDSIHTVGLRSHYVASCYAVPLLHNKQYEQQKNLQKQRPIPRPLIIMISSFGGISYTFNVPYGVGKAGVDRLTKDMDIEFNDSNMNISVISLYPGVVNTELTKIYIQNGDWDQYVGIPILPNNFESPRFTGRAIVELALDSNNFQKSGTYQVVAELAEEYEFVDEYYDHDLIAPTSLPGTTTSTTIRRTTNQPPSIRSLRFLLPTYAFNDELRQFIPNHFIPNWKLPFWMMSMGKPPPKK